MDKGLVVEAYIDRKIAEYEKNIQDTEKHCNG